MKFRMVPQAVSISTESQRVWDVITKPEFSQEWRSAIFQTDWSPGSPIDVTATIGTKRYRDRGYVLRQEFLRLLQYTYWSRVSGLPDEPEGWSTITMTLQPDNTGTLVTVYQEVPPSPIRHGKGWQTDEKSGLKHVEFYWRMTLPILKAVAERESSAK